MLIQVRDCLREHGRDANRVSLYGQEKMGITWSICKMNMLLHGIPDADIRQQDTLREPQHHEEDGQLRRFDRVLANPPFSQNICPSSTRWPPMPTTSVRAGATSTRCAPACSKVSSAGASS